MPTKTKIKILLADDHQVVRMGLAAIIAAESDLRLVGEANDGNEAVKFARELNPDVILTSTDYIEDPIGEILSREGWGDVTAVANKAVYPISSQTSNQPNQHIVEALVDMAVAVYPEAYAALLADEAA